MNINLKKKITAILMITFSFLPISNLKADEPDLSNDLKLLQNHTSCIHWETVGDTPDAELEYKPQGLTWDTALPGTNNPSRLILSNTWNETKSRVYEIDPITMEMLRFFDMPKEATHTSGLALFQKEIENQNELLIYKTLIAADHHTNQIYFLDYEQSMESKKAVQSAFIKSDSSQKNVTFHPDSGFRGTSAATLIPAMEITNQENILVVSDHAAISGWRTERRAKKETFRRSLKFRTLETVLFQLPFISKTAEDFSNSISEGIKITKIATFTSQKYSQGLAFANLQIANESEKFPILLESEGKSGKIYVSLLKKSSNEPNSSLEKIQINIVNGPDGIVQDLAWDPIEQAIWTTDEKYYKIYKGKFLSKLDCEK